MLENSLHELLYIIIKYYVEILSPLIFSEISNLIKVRKLGHRKVGLELSQMNYHKPFA